MRLPVSIFAIAAALCATQASATLVSLGACPSNITCTIIDGADAPNPVTRDPNNNSLIAWDEVQNFTLTAPLRVDRVFDENADFITSAPGGDFFIDAGTIVSSHYLQYDGPRFQTQISLDSQIFAFITADQNLFDSDALLGFPGLDYNDFSQRGIENNDSTDFNGENVDINWGTTSPGDWARLITAFSPAAEEPEQEPDISNPIPLPAGIWLLGSAIGLTVLRRKRA